MAREDRELAELDEAIFEFAYLVAGLAIALPDVLVVVISQDGDARFVRRRDGSVICWDQV